jgi:hypothetical protein
MNNYVDNFSFDYHKHKYENGFAALRLMHIFCV